MRRHSGSKGIIDNGAAWSAACARSGLGSGGHGLGGGRVGFPLQHRAALLVAQVPRKGFLQQLRGVAAAAAGAGSSVDAAAASAVIGGFLTFLCGTFTNAAARAPSEISAFSVDAHLAPSTLLGGR